MATAYNDIHESVQSMAGPLAETSVGGFMLARAWLNKTPRGQFERLLNAAFGFGMVGNALVSGWCFIHDPDVRQAYFEQKGSHGFGDFDQVVEQTGLAFDAVVWIYISGALLALIIPIIIYILLNHLNFNSYEDEMKL